MGGLKDAQKVEGPVLTCNAQSAKRLRMGFIARRGGRSYLASPQTLRRVCPGSCFARGMLARSFSCPTRRPRPKPEASFQPKSDSITCRSYSPGTTARKYSIYHQHSDSRDDESVPCCIAYRRACHSIGSTRISTSQYTLGQINRTGP